MIGDDQVDLGHHVYHIGRCLISADHVWDFMVDLNHFGSSPGHLDPICRKSIIPGISLKPDHRTTF
jgi:hypothetical protein